MVAYHRCEMERSFEVRRDKSGNEKSAEVRKQDTDNRSGAVKSKIQ